MFYIVVNKPDFEYDIYGLVQAFLPREELEIIYDVPEEERASLPYQTRNHTAADRDVDANSLSVVYGAGEIRLELSAGKVFLKNVNLPADWPEHPAQDKSVRPEMKNILKRAVYDLLSEYTGKTLPWGTLTGIRPTKVPLQMVTDGATDEEIRAFMTEKYETTDGKISIATEIAHREHEVLSKLDLEKGYSIYIGIPFCPTTCLYCSFPSYARASYEGQVDAYLTALGKEIAFTGDAMKERILDTVYIGGGTPTSLSAEELDRLFHMLEEYLPMESVKEFTVEAGRPDSITWDKLLVMKRHNVSRISVNPQTMNDKTLKLIGRHHTAEQLKEAFRLSRKAGFDDINMDLILGLPGETVEDVRYTLSEVEKMAPDNLTIHSLAIKAKSRLNQEWEAYQNYAMENSNELMQMSMDTAERLGLEPYYLYRQKNMIGNLENIGFSKPGLAGLYNILIMEEVQTIVACGAGVVSKRVFPDGRIERCDNVKDVSLYISKIVEMIDRKRKLFS